MTDPTGLTKPDWLSGETSEDAAIQKLAVMSAVNTMANVSRGAAPRDAARPNSNLTNVFSQLAGLQKQIAEQTMALERCLRQQQDDVGMAVVQLPDLKERLTWLIASFYEQGKKNEAIRDRFEVVAADIAGLRDAQERGQLAQREMEERTRALAERLDALAARQAAQESRLGEWAGPVAELGRKLDAIAEELKRHDANFASVQDSLRSLSDVQNHWKAAMGQMAETMLNAKAVPTPTPPSLR